MTLLWSQILPVIQEEEQYSSDRSTEPIVLKPEKISYYQSLDNQELPERFLERYQQMLHRLYIRWIIPFCKKNKLLTDIITFRRFCVLAYMNTEEINKDV